MNDAELAPNRLFQFDSLFRPEVTRIPQPYFKRMRETNPVLRTASMWTDGSSTVRNAQRRRFRAAQSDCFLSRFGQVSLEVWSRKRPGISNASCQRRSA